MPNTYIDYEAPVANYTFTFPYLDVSHVKVFVDDVAKVQGTHYTVETSPTRVVFTAGNTPANGAIVRIRRVTFKDSALVDFANGSTLLESDLDTAVRQTLYINQETTELNDTALQIGAGTSDFYAQDKKITHLATPTQANDATNKSYVDTAGALKVSKAGDTMSGNLAMGGNKVTGLGSPSAPTDAATRDYVNTSIDNSVRFASTISPETYSFTANGTATLFTLGPDAPQNIYNSASWLVTLNGVVQKPDVDYYILYVGGGLNLSFTVAPANGVLIVARALGYRVPIGAAVIEPQTLLTYMYADASVTTSKIASAAVTSDKLASSLDFSGKSVTNLNKGAVGLGNVQNLDTTNASNIATGTLNSNLLPTSGVIAGTFNPQNVQSFQVDNKGRITSVANFSGNSNKVPLAIATLNVNWGKATNITQYTTYSTWQRIGGTGSSVWTVSLNNGGGTGAIGSGNGLAPSGTYTVPTDGIYRATIQGLLLGATSGYCQVALGSTSTNLPFYAYQAYIGYGHFHLTGIFDLITDATIAPWMYITSGSWFTHAGHTNFFVEKIS
jgi:hypothetical protein